MIKQNKGKDLHKVPLSRLSQGPYYLSKKFDGHYIQIQFYEGEVRMWTSGGKEFLINGLANYIKTHYTENFHIEAEYNYDCEGKLGDRGKSAILTTYRTNFTKGIRTEGSPDKDIIRVTDILDTEDLFETRVSKIADMFYGKDWFNMPEQIYVIVFSVAQILVAKWVKLGYEGGMLKAPNHLYQPGKRTNDIIKLKPRLTADLLCADWKEGTGKYEGMIGSLLLTDSKGIHVWAGSGLDDAARVKNPNYYLGKVIEIEYERIDETYIQPIIKHIRTDKLPSEID